MIDFSFTKEQVLIQKAMREFAEKELLPNYSHFDKAETFPWEQWQKMAKFILQLFLIWSATGAVFLIIAQAIQWGPF